MLEESAAERFGKTGEGEGGEFPPLLSLFVFSLSCVREEE